MFNNLEKLEKKKQEYKQWKQAQFDNKTAFQQLFVNFKDSLLLRQLSSNALRLYLYFGFLSRNYTGESWPSITMIMQYFGFSIDEAREAINELEKYKLVERFEVELDGKSRTYTCLLPYTSDQIERIEEKN